MLQEIYYFSLISFFEFKNDLMVVLFSDDCKMALSYTHDSTISGPVVNESVLSEGIASRESGKNQRPVIVQPVVDWVDVGNACVRMLKVYKLSFLL